MRRIYVIILALFCICGCKRFENPKEFTQEWVTMGTFASCTVSAENSEQAKKCFKIVKGEFDKISKSFNIYNTNSIISIINRDAQFSPIKVNDYEFCIITNSFACSQKTETTFNPACLPLIRLWGFNGGTNTTVPTQTMIDDAMKRVDISNVICESNTIFFSGKSMQLDMGGVAKGSAVDMAYDELEKAGCKEFIVNLGGNIRAKTLKKYLLIGIRNPFDKEDIIGTLKLKNGEAVATSGDYERFIMLDGVKYPHIIDPRSGYPVRSTVATTIVAPNATMSDILSTATFVLGKEKINYVSSKFPDVAILVISKNDGEMSISVSSEDIFDFL